ncbi:MAG: DUF2254 domain-containing protein [Gemmatimonadetes bacterium]|nr:DUF2254 domain-containing protein [Gemmatimonadota bacterium]
MARLKALWLRMIDSLWFVPAVLTLAGAVAAILLVNANDTLLGQVGADGRWWAFGGTAEGAAGVLSAISGSIITVTGVVFSVTIVALQLASSQFTPRVLRQFTSDRANQIVLGVFIGTFTYTLLVQRTLRTADAGEEFVPNIAVTGAVLLALVSIAFLIFFINHAARSIQASVIIDSVALDTLASIRRVFPERMEEDDEEPLVLADAYTEGRDEPSRAIRVTKSGYIQEIDRATLKKVAELNHLFIRLDAEIGRFILPGDEVMCVWPAVEVDEQIEADLRGALLLGMERTPHQDLKLGVIELMDIAVKAMSPSVNDPTTALNAMDRLGELLLELAWRKRGDRVEMSGHGRPVLITRRPVLEDTLGIAFDQLRHYAADNPMVAIAMMRLLGRLSATAPFAARAAFARQLHEVKSTAENRIKDPVDRTRFDVAAVEALRVAAGDSRPQVEARGG